MIVLLELLTALLEHIDLILQLSFFQQEFTLSYKYLTYYAGIMLNAFRYLLCSNLCQHNRQVPIHEAVTVTLSMSDIFNCHTLNEIIIAILYITYLMCMVVPNWLTTIANQQCYNFLLRLIKEVSSFRIGYTSYIR